MLKLLAVVFLAFVVPDCSRSKVTLVMPNHPTTEVA